MRETDGARRHDAQRQRVHLKVKSRRDDPAVLVKPSRDVEVQVKGQVGVDKGSEQQGILRDTTEMSDDVSRQCQSDEAPSLRLIYGE